MWVTVTDPPNGAGFGIAFVPLSVCVFGFKRLPLAHQIRRRRHRSRRRRWRRCWPLLLLLLTRF